MILTFQIDGSAQQIVQTVRAWFDIMPVWFGTAQIRSFDLFFH